MRFGSNNKGGLTLNDLIEKCQTIKNVLVKYGVMIDCIITDYNNDTEEDNHILKNFLDELPYYLKESIETIKNY